VCLALGFYKGAFHVEAIYTETGPMLIECNPRVGGGPVVEYNKVFRMASLNPFVFWLGFFKNTQNRTI
jgi:biotin carboxylase